MRPSWRSFSSVMRAISRRTPSKAESTTAFGVSSMMKSTPVRFSRARMLRPSRPMMRPFMSSDGSWTTETVVSAAWLAARRCMATERIERTRRSASRFVSSSTWRMIRAESWRAWSSTSLSSAFLAWPALSPATRSSARVCSSQLVERLALDVELRGARLELALALLDLLGAPVERTLERLRARRAAHELLLTLAHLPVAGRGGLGNAVGQDGGCSSAVDDCGRDDPPCEDHRRDHEFHCRVSSSPAAFPRSANFSPGSWSDGPTAGAADERRWQCGAAAALQWRCFGTRIGFDGRAGPVGAFTM